MPWQAAEMLSFTMNYHVFHVDAPAFDSLGQARTWRRGGPGQTARAAQNRSFEH